MADAAPELIRFACKCGKRFEVARKFIGETTTCPSCDAPLTVPAESTFERKRKRRSRRPASKPQANSSVAAAGPQASPDHGGMTLQEMLRQPAPTEKMALYAGVGGFVGGLLFGMLLMLPFVWRSAPEPVASSPVPTETPSDTPADPAVPNIPTSPAIPSVAPKPPIAPAVDDPEDPPPAQDPWETADFARLNVRLSQQYFGELDPQLFPSRDFPIRFEDNQAAKLEAIGSGMGSDELVMRFELGAFPDEQGAMDVVIFLFRDQLRAWPRQRAKFQAQVWDTRTRIDDDGEPQQAMFDLRLRGEPNEQHVVTGVLSGRVLFLGIGAFTFNDVPFSLEPFELEKKAVPPTAPKVEPADGEPADPDAAEPDPAEPDQD